MVKRDWGSWVGGVMMTEGEERCQQVGRDVVGYDTAYLIDPISIFASAAAEQHGYHWGRMPV